MRVLRPLVFACLAALAAVGCTPTNSGPATGASLRAEQNQSRALLQEFRQRDMLVEDARLNRYVNGIAARIDAQRPRGAPKLRTFIVKDPDVNAFTTGGGYVFVNAGLLAAMENEAQFAMVLAHEVAHIDRGHVTEGMQTRQTAGVLGAVAGIAGALAGAPAELTRMAVGTGQQLYVADFTRQQETDADQMGFRYLSGGGYNAAAGAKSFEVLRRLYGEQSGVAKFFSSHPQSSERQSQLTRLARSQGADQGRTAGPEYLRQTKRLRQAALKFYERNGRAKEAAQARRNLSRTR